MNQNQPHEVFNSLIQDFFLNPQPSKMQEPSFNFTFETESQYSIAKFRNNYIDNYEIVRMVKEYEDGIVEDFPVHSREEYNNLLKSNSGKILDVYQATHSYDMQDYL